MSPYREFHLPNRHEEGSYDMFKRCYINIDGLLKKTLGKELAYVLNKANQPACLFTYNFKSVKQMVKDYVGNEDIRLHEIPYRKNEIYQFTNFYFYLDNSLVDFIEFFENPDMGFSEEYMDMINIHLYVSWELFNYHSFIYQKRYIRKFWSILKKYDFDIIKPKDMNTTRDGKRRVYATNNNDINDLKRSTNSFISSHDENAIMLDTTRLSNLKIQHTTFTNDHYKQSFKYF